MHVFDLPQVAPVGRNIGGPKRRWRRFESGGLEGFWIHGRRPHVLNGRS
jgi:hypothetical protein